MFIEAQGWRSLGLFLFVIEEKVTQGLPSLHFLYDRMVTMIEHEITIRVRYCETDAMGYLHHGNFANYYEMGRTELLRAQGGDYRAMEEAGLFLVVVRLDCRFHSPARYDDLLTLKTRVARVSAVKIEHSYQLFRGPQLLATATSVLACVDRQGHIQRIPESLKAEG